MEQNLKELRKALIEVDELRTRDGISDQERVLLEKSSTALRDAERLLIKNEQKELSESLSALELELKALSKDIRSRVEKMNKISKFADKVGDLFGVVLKALKLIEEIKF